MSEIIMRVGETELRTTLEDGEALLKAGYKLQLNERIGFGDCGGSCVCGTCHVYVEEGAEGFDEPDPIEEGMLDTFTNYKANSRLACQLRLKPGQGRVKVIIAKEGIAE